MTLSTFIDPDELVRLLDNGDAILVDVRQPYFYTQGHIPGSLNLPLVTLGTRDRSALSAPALAERLGALGIGSDTHIVLYDDGASPTASAVYWLLEYRGHLRLSILDGGITRWRHDGRDVEYAPVKIHVGLYEPGVEKPTALASLDEVRAAIGTPDTVIVDVRTPAEYLGLRASAARDGHVPTAINIDVTNNFSRGESGVAQLKPADELRLLYETAGITRDKHVIVYCQSGNRSSLSYAVLRGLGYGMVSNYVGSWQEWGNREDTTVSTE